jgi:protoporphyrinogen/coproporphyrinogen III oxidase
MTRVLVVGGGISGLAAAWDLIKAPDVEVTVVEAAPRLGGKIVTEPFAGVDLDAGPDSFLARRPAAAELAREAGLADALVAPASGQAWLWTRRQLRRLPTGLVLGVPADIRALARSGVMPAPDVARAALDLVLPGRPVGADEDVSVGELIARRMGRGVQLGLVDPLVGGVNAAHTDGLSAAVAAPQLLAAARRDRSLVRGLRAAGVTGTAGGAVVDSTTQGPVFLTVSGGLARLVDALASGIVRGGGEIVVGDGAAALSRDGGGGWVVTLAGGRVVSADAVVIACPAAPAGRLLEPVSRDAAAHLGSLESASVSLVTLAYQESVLSKRPEGSGFLVPRPEGRLMTASSWVSTKWPHVVTPGLLLIRASAGRIDDRRAEEMDDDELIAAIHAELASAMGIGGRPIEARVHRWEAAFPQYEVGHLDRIARTERRLAADAPGVVLAGAALRGVGIATCVAGGRAAAASVIARVATSAR